MKYGDKEIKNAVIINGKLYEAVFGNNLGCYDCEIPGLIKKCIGLCYKFEDSKSHVIFKRIKGNLLLKLHEDEEG